MENITFIPLEEKHLTLLHQWFQIPHVKKWYARNETYSLEMIQEKYRPRIKDNKKIPNYIVNLNNQPVGYIQMYNLDHALPDGIDDYEHLLFKEYPSNKIAGIDLFIANIEFLEKGISTKLLNQFMLYPIMLY